MELDAKKKEDRNSYSVARVTIKRTKYPLWNAYKKGLEVYGWTMPDSKTMMEYLLQKYYYCNIKWFEIGSYRKKLFIKKIVSQIR